MTREEKRNIEIVRFRKQRIEDKVDSIDKSIQILIFENLRIESDLGDAIDILEDERKTQIMKLQSLELSFPYL